MKDIEMKKRVLKDQRDEILEKEKEIRKFNELFDEKEREFEKLQKELDAYEVSVYVNHFDFESSDEYREKIKQIREEQKDLISLEQACVCHTTWRLNDSESKGRVMTKRNIKLMLRSFNNECNAAISKVSYKNIQTMEKRIIHAYSITNKFGKSNEITIANEYLQLRLAELRLHYEFLEKKEFEKEEKRIIQAQIREEEKARKEFEKALKQIEDEEIRYRKALKKAKQDLIKATDKKLDTLLKKIRELELKLVEAENNKRAISQAQITKAGHIYVLSNIGAFGESIYKIGMTRRLEPLDRV